MHDDMLEREVKLQFDGPDQARAAVRAAGALPLRPRRLQADALLDTSQGSLRTRGCALRVRIEPALSLLTFKGPIQPSRVKVREEYEIRIEDAPLLLRILEAIGYHVWFRYEKYREEFQLHGVVVAVDETPIGTFIELEGGEGGIDAAARALGLGPDAYLLDSYRALFERQCRQRGVSAGDMVFDPS